MMTAEELVKCPMTGLEGIAGDDDTVSVSGDGLVRILKEHGVFPLLTLHRANERLPDAHDPGMPCGIYTILAVRCNIANIKTFIHSCTQWCNLPL
jgi:hypothetical protein